MFLCKNILFAWVSSMYRYETNGTSTAEVQDGVASTLGPHNNREYVSRDVIHTIKNAQNEIKFIPNQ